VFLGYHRETHEYVFHARGRVIRSRALQRVPANARSSMRAPEEVRASPYSMYRKPDEDAVIVPDPSLAAEQERRARELVRRDIALKRSDFEKHGYTGDGCPRCDYAIRFGWDYHSTHSHSTACRDRLREAIRSSGPAGQRRIEDMEKRKQEFVDVQPQAIEGQEGVLGEKEDEDKVPEKFVPFADDGMEDNEQAEHQSEEAMHDYEEPMQDALPMAGAPIQYSPASPGDDRM